MESQAAPELLVVSATASSEPAAYAHALRQLLGGVLGGIAASGAPHGGLRLAVASGRALTVSREPAPHETRVHKWRGEVDRLVQAVGRGGGAAEPDVLALQSLAQHAPGTAHVLFVAQRGAPAPRRLRVRLRPARAPPLAVRRRPQILETRPCGEVERGCRKRRRP